MHVTKKCAQKRKTSLRFLFGPIPVDQRGRGEPMSKVVQPRSMTVAGAAQPDPSRGGIERPANLRRVQPIAPTGNKQVRGHWPLGPMALASGDVVGEHLTGGGMQAYQPILTKFGAADRQHPGLQIDVLKL